MRQTLMLKTAAATVLIGASLTAHAANPNEFLVFNYDLYNDGNSDLNGRLFVPTGLTPGEKYPLVVFFHGAGGSTSDNINQVNSNIDNLLAAAKTHKFFLYAPQAGWFGSEQFSRALNMIGKAADTYPVDTNRLYATGLSQGGGATWDIASMYPRVFAAAVPIAGLRNNDQILIPKLTSQPIWAFHARDDGNISTDVQNTRGILNEVSIAAGKGPMPTFPGYTSGAPYYNDGSTYYNDGTIQFSEYATGGHGIWGKVYSTSQNPQMYTWMLNQTRTAPAPLLGETLLFDLGVNQKFKDSQNRIWNSTTDGVVNATNLTTPVFNFARTTAGDGTNVRINIVDRFEWQTGDGVAAGSMYDTEHATDSWYNNYADQIAILDIAGLAPGGEYRLALFASQLTDDAGFKKVTRYTVNGQFRDLDVVGNTSNKATFESLLADANGVLRLTVSAAPDGSSRMSFLGAMELTAIPEPTTVLPLICAVGMTLRPRRRSTESTL